MNTARKIFLSVVFLLFSAGFLYAQNREEALRRDVEFLSDTLCAGRASGTAGNAAAAFHIIMRMKELGYNIDIQSFRIDSVRVGHNIVAFKSANADNLRGIADPVKVLTAYYDGLGILNGRLYPGADSNASGTAALLALAQRLSGAEKIIFAFLDGHFADMAGAEVLKKSLSGRKIGILANIDIIGSTLAPVDKYWKDFMIILGAEGERFLLEDCNAGLGIHYYHTYYRSRTFTDLFYRKAGDHRVFVADGVKTVLFTSGITSETNKPSDSFDKLDYPVFERRVEFIARYMLNYGRK